MRVHLFFICLQASLAAPGFAQSDCDEQARTELEQFYCDVRRRGQGATLPSLADFQRNSPRVQAALLKGPARRLGLSLPEITPPETATPERTTAPAAPPANRPATPAAQDTEVSVSLRPPSPESASRPVEQPVDSLAGCQLQATAIRCRDAVYQLQTNLDNRQLASDALSESNTLGLQNFTGSHSDQQALQHYLVDSYHRYIEKMLDIGLGASTLSYTRFYYTYQEMRNQQQDFAARFETTYAYLKKDKASMAIKKRYSDELPSAISQCDPLSDRIIVCDDSNTNWVFLSP